MIDQVTADKWNGRYRAHTPADFEPPQVLLRNLHLLPEHGRALDVACGMGPAARLLAGRGLDTLGVDISAQAIDQLNDLARRDGLPLRAEVRDLVRQGLPPGSFEVVVVTRYLQRDLFPALLDALAPGGLLCYQTFTTERREGPSNPDFLLRPGELPVLCAGLRLRYYREDGQSAGGLPGEALYIGQAAPG